MNCVRQFRHEVGVGIPWQNVAVRHTPSKDDLWDPQGRVFAELIAEGVRGEGFPDAEAKCYSDRGWSVDASAGAVRLSAEVVLDQEPDLWLLQLHVVNEPLLFSRVLGAGVKEHAGALGRFASAVHRVLESHGCRDLRWCLGGYPGAGWTSATPFRPPQDAE